MATDTSLTPGALCVRWLIIATASCTLCSCQSIDSDLLVKDDNTELAAVLAADQFPLADTRRSKESPLRSSAENGVQPDGPVFVAPPAIIQLVDEELLEELELKPEAPTAAGEIGQGYEIISDREYTVSDDVPDQFGESEIIAGPIDGSTANGFMFEMSDSIQPQQPLCDVPNRSWGHPRDEFVCDGGDVGVRARVRNNWSVDGLELEDTVAHYDTLGGETQVVASNRSCVYAPRFAAVRQVRHLHENEVHRVAVGTRGTQTPIYQARDQQAGAVKQPRATVRAVGTSIGMTLEEHDRGLTAENVDSPFETRNQLHPIEDLHIVETGLVAIEDGPRLIEAAGAARAWSAVETAQVTIEGSVALEKRSVRQGQESVIYETPEGRPRLRLVKLASTCSAHPGDVVEFSIRFDNVGDEPIGNVTILDVLTNRLEFVEGSDECTVNCDFVADDNSGEGLQLRWEIIEPLEPGTGGVVRFRCQVR